MSVPDGLLVLLRDEAKHGYQLATDFSRRTAGCWALNTGQVYTTLERLARDGFVVTDGADAESRRRRYRLTERGRERADRWLAEMPATAAPRDELVLRVLLTAAADPVTATAVVDIQRRQLVGRLQDLRRAQRAAADDLIARLAADAAATRVEADLRWLDLCDERLRAAPSAPPNRAPSPSPNRRPSAATTLPRDASPSRSGTASPRGAAPSPNRRPSAATTLPTDAGSIPPPESPPPESPPPGAERGTPEAVTEAVQEGRP
jgi:DNA-binding PadR family transcriptional regulator